MARGTASGRGLTTVGADCLLMAVAHVAHDCSVGNHVILANSVNMAGHVVIEDYVHGEGSRIAALLAALLILLDAPTLYLTASATALGLDALVVVIIIVLLLVIQIAFPVKAHLILAQAGLPHRKVFVTEQHKRGTVPFNGFGWSR